MSNKSEENKTHQPQWQKLSKEQYFVCHDKGTEAPFSGKYCHFDQPGEYQCVCCGTNLFSSTSKFDSGCGWPSFFSPISDQVIQYQQDFSMAAMRIEITCKNCGSHLGHVFDDGPAPTFKRYCVNSLSLNFKEMDS